MQIDRAHINSQKDHAQDVLASMVCSGCKLSRTSALIQPEEVLHFGRPCAPVLSAPLAPIVIFMSMLSGTDILVGMLKLLCFGAKNVCDVDATHAKLAYGL